MYRFVESLSRRGANSARPPCPIAEYGIDSLEVDFDAGERMLPDDSRQPGAGHDDVTRYPARWSVGVGPLVASTRVEDGREIVSSYREQRQFSGWLVRRNWRPAHGYAAGGAHDELTMADGSPLLG